METNIAMPYLSQNKLNYWIQLNFLFMYLYSVHICDNLVTDPNK
jgi:hypothetical protein